MGEPQGDCQILTPSCPKMKAKKFLILILSTFFYVGYFPFIPGTMGSMAGIGIFYLVKDSSILYACLTLGILILGFLVSGEAEGIFKVKDCRCIVIDEVSGMLLSLMFIPYDFKIVIVAFILFRIFDALKPYPINLLQKFKGSLGVMSDDIMAGIYTNIVLQIALRLASFKTS